MNNTQPDRYAKLDNVYHAHYLHGRDVGIQQGMRRGIVMGAAGATFVLALGLLVLMAVLR
jgi:hypothetical protein